MAQAKTPLGKGSRSDARLNVIFGDVLRSFRIEKGLTQEELAIECGMDRAYVSELERGLKEPCLSTILRLTNTLKVPVADVMARVEATVQLSSKSLQ